MATNFNSGPSSQLLISYMTLRKLVGLLGIILPFVLVIGAKLIFSNTSIESTISHYYHTGMRDVFVGFIVGIGMFFFCYKGPEKIDGVMGNLAGIFATGLALFPTTASDKIVGSSLIIGKFHFAFATLFFLSLVYFSIFLFTKSKPDQAPTPRKLIRNKVYKICGIIMLCCLLCIFVYFQFVEDRYPIVQEYKPVFWLESIALWSFGISWITKGEMILGDIEQIKMQ